MAMLRLSLALSFAAVVAGLVSNVAHPAVNRAQHFVSNIQFKHRLRVCNAYPSEEALDVYRGHEKLTKLPLDYKMCGDFATPLLAGDKLAFRVGGASAGTFTISDLPNNDAVLFLVIQRHDTLSSAVSFQSHVFANLLNAQVAVLDTYKGRAHGLAEIRDGSTEMEQLRYNSVVAMNPGEYEVNLVDLNKKKQVARGLNLVALNRESYVIIRTGVESQQGAQYPQELMVYPMSDRALLHSASMRANPAAVGAFVALMSFLISYFP